MMIDTLQNTTRQLKFLQARKALPSTLLNSGMHQEVAQLGQLGEGILCPSSLVVPKNPPLFSIQWGPLTTSVQQ